MRGNSVIVLFDLKWDLLSQSVHYNRGPPRRARPKLTVFDNFKDFHCCLSLPKCHIMVIMHNYLKSIVKLETNVKL